MANILTVKVDNDLALSGLQNELCALLDSIGVDYEVSEDLSDCDHEEALDALRESAVEIITD